MFLARLAPKSRRSAGSEGKSGGGAGSGLAALARSSPSVGSRAPVLEDTVTILDRSLAVGPKTTTSSIQLPSPRHVPPGRETGTGAASRRGKGKRAAAAAAEGGAGRRLPPLDSSAGGGAVASGALSVHLAEFYAACNEMKAERAARRAADADGGRVRFAADALEPVGERVGEWTYEHAELVYQSKCRDLSLAPSEERHRRFLDVVSTSCVSGHVRLEENGLGPHSAESLAMVLVSMGTCTNLNLANNLVRNRGALAIAATLRRLPMLTALDLRSNDIGAEGSLAVFEALCGHTTLTQVDFSGIKGVNRNQVSPAACEALARALADRNCVLASLALASNGMGEAGCLALVAGLYDNRETLTSLDVSTNSLGPSGCTDVCKALPSTALKSLSIARNAMGSTGAIALADALSDPRLQLTVLDIGHNEIDWKGGGMIGSALADVPSLQTFLAADNRFGDMGAIEVAVALGLHQTLTHVSLAGNGISGRATEHWREMLKTNTSLTRLDLSRNDVGDVGAVRISEGLVLNGSLLQLDLSVNNIKAQGCVALMRMLARNAALQRLIIRDSRADETVASVVLNSLKRNMTIQDIEFGFPAFSFSAAATIRDALEDNRRMYRESAVERTEAALQAAKEEFLAIKAVKQQMELEREQNAVVQRKLESKRRQLEDVRASTEAQVAEVRRQLTAAEANKRLADEKLNQSAHSVEARRKLFDVKLKEISDLQRSEHARAEELYKELRLVQREVTRLEGPVTARVLIDLRDKLADETTKRQAYELQLLTEEGLILKLQQSISALEKQLGKRPSRRGATPAAASKKASPRTSKKARA